MLTDPSAIGAELVDQLGEVAERNLLVRWMAVHLSDLLKRHKSASGQAKQELAHQCADIILKLWSNRHNLPAGARLLESFQPLFQTLEQLAESTSRYPMVGAFRGPKAIADDGVLGAALSIDRAAAALIRYALAEFTAALAKKDKRWVEIAKAMSSFGPDIKIIFRLTSDSETLVEENARLKKEKIEEVEKMIEHLELFEKKAPALRKFLESRLKTAKRKK